jgi:hypothetical protein
VGLLRAGGALGAMVLMFLGSLVVPAQPPAPTPTPIPVTVASVATPTPQPTLIWPAAEGTAGLWVAAMDPPPWATAVPTAQPLVIPPAPVVTEAQAWALATLGQREYDALYRIVRYESKWNPAAINARSGACGLGQAWPCSKLSDLVPDWPTNPIGQLQLWLIPYCHHKWGTFVNAWQYETVHGLW